jgi:hypothetical protein
MNKYLVVAVLPLLASCTATRPHQRPSQKASAQALKATNGALAIAPTGVVNESLASSADVAEDGANFVSGVGVTQVRSVGGGILGFFRRSTNLVRGESNKYINTVHDTDDQVAGIAGNEVNENFSFSKHHASRVLNTGDSLVDTAVGSVDRSWDLLHNVFGGFLRRSVKKSVAAVQRPVDSFIGESGDDVTAIVSDQTRWATATALGRTRQVGNLARRHVATHANNAYDALDGVTELADAEITDTQDLVQEGYGRVAHAGGTVVSTTMNSYSSLWDRVTRGIFGGLLRGTVRDTKNYMVGSVADNNRDSELPGSAFNKKIPDLSGYTVAAVAPAAQTPAVTAPAPKTSSK